MSRDNEILNIICEEEREPDWLVPDLFVQGGLICLGGEPGVGKSYISYTIGLAIASGSKVMGLLTPTEPRRVLYFDEENSSADRSKYLRRSWFGMAHQLKRDPFDPDLLDLLQTNFWPLNFELGTDDWRDKAAFDVEQIQPHLIIFDTATPAFNIEDENSNAEATQAIKGVRDLMQMTDPVATALVLKHAKMRTEKGGRRSMRGAKAWQGAADGVMFQVKAAGRPRRDGLALTRLEPDKTRAYGLRQTIYITPQWTDDDRNGLSLSGSYSADKSHKAAEDAEEDNVN